MNTHAEPGGGRWVTVGLCVSLFAHAGLVGLLVSASAGAAEAHPPERSDEPVPEDRLRFGLDTPARATIDWLGIEEAAEEHLAPVEDDAQQAALALDAAGGPAVPAETPAPDPAPTPEQPVPARASPPDVVEVPDGSEAVVPEREPERAEEPVGPPAPDPVLDAVRERPPERRAEASPASDTGSGPARGPGSGEAPGLPGERESDPIAQTVDLKKWTSPAVGKGIEIRPVRPRWPTHFMVGRLTRPAIVEIRFARGESGVGEVKLAEFARVERPDGRVEILNSGDREVDSIVLNAIYRWTAVGDEIDALAQGETVRVRVRLFTVR